MSLPTGRPGAPRRGPARWLGAVIGRVPAPMMILLAGGGAFFLLHASSWSFEPIEGFADVLQHAVGPVETGRLASIDVRLGQAVRKGETLGRMDGRGLQAGRERLQAEFSALESRVEAERRLQAGELLREDLRRLRMQADETGERAELLALSSQLARLDGPEAHGLVPTTELDELRRRRDALVARVAAYEGSRRADPGAAPEGAAAAWAEEIERLVAPHREAARAKRLELQAVDVFLEDLVLRAPSEGVVSSILHQPGDVVAAGDPVLTIVAPVPGRVVVSVPERLASRVAPGARVTLRCPGFLTEGIVGRVVALGPIVEELPLRSWRSPRAPAWGRRVIVETEPKAWLPGQRFHVRFE